MIQHLVLLAASLLVIYIARTWLSDNRIPGPTGWPIIGNMLDGVRASSENDLSALLLEYTKRYGRIFRMKLSPADTIYIISDALSIKLILTDKTMFGRTGVFRDAAIDLAPHALFVLPDSEEWTRHRKFIQPAFGPPHLRHTYSTVTQIMQILANHLELKLSTSSESHVKVDMHHLVTSIAMDTM